MEYSEHDAGTYIMVVCGGKRLTSCAARFLEFLLSPAGGDCMHKADAWMGLINSTHF